MKGDCRFHQPAKPPPKIKEVRGGRPNQRCQAEGLRGRIPTLKRSRFPVPAPPWACRLRFPCHMLPVSGRERERPTREGAGTGATMIPTTWILMPVTCRKCLPLPPLKSMRYWNEGPECSMFSLMVYLSQTSRESFLRQQFKF